MKSEYQKILKASGKPEQWQQVKWLGCEESPTIKIEAYARLFGAIPVILWRNLREKESAAFFGLNETTFSGLWQYTVSAGANSDNSHTGLTHSDNLADAQLFAERMANNRFSSKGLPFVYPELKITVKRN